MPLILPGNVGSATASTTFSVANSLRFNRADEAILTRTQSTSPTHDDKCTMSFWFKQGSQSETASRGFAVFGGDDANNRAFFYIETDGQLYYYGKLGGSANITINSNAMYRDSSAWYHYCLAIDTTQGTAANRIRTYINGVEVTSYVSASYPSQNDNMPFVKGADMMIGSTRGGSYQLYGWAECYMSEVHFVDGQQLTPSSFTEYDEDSPTILKPKDCKADLTYGTNGFYLTFSDSSALGDDTSGNGNDFTATNLAAVDQATDTPTNNFCTGNPIIHGGKLPALSQGNCLFISGGDWMHVPSTIGVANGKWYAEFKCVAKTGGQMMGVVDAGSIAGWGASPPLYVGNDALGHCYQDNGNKQTGDTATSYGATYTDGDIIGAALNADDGEITFYKNNAVQASGTAITLPTSTSSDGIWFWLPSVETGTIAANWGGCSAFAISSAANDENGYGVFEYAPPSDYLAMCTKNLATNG